MDGYIHTYIHTYIHMRACVRVCVCACISFSNNLKLEQDIRRQTYKGYLRTHMVEAVPLLLLGPVTYKDIYQDTYGTYEDTYGTYEDTYAVP